MKFTSKTRYFSVILLHRLIVIIFFGTYLSFLRSVSYREFSRLIYGMMGIKRIPLPACAYSTMRKQFPVNKDESYAGFDLDKD